MHTQSSQFRLDWCIRLYLVCFASTRVDCLLGCETCIATMLPNSPPSKHPYRVCAFSPSNLLSRIACTPQSLTCRTSMSIRSVLRMWCHPCAIWILDLAKTQSDRILVHAIPDGRLALIQRAARMWTSVPRWTLPINIAKAITQVAAILMALLLACGESPRLPRDTLP
jgi:hypothetical protein